MSIGGDLWLLVRMFSSFLDHCMTAVHLTRLCRLFFNTPYTLVDVTVGNFLRMCLVGMKRTYSSPMSYVLVQRERLTTVVFSAVDSVPGTEQVVDSDLHSKFMGQSSMVRD
ncbi:hypothetical protein EVAR_320_1 [Eumeta japonica]|uniref:Secreted protein n=1 Tax=Eumeta variegata TaxID=151549 RepID=A0A4C1SCU8_EUMVA|nr:hypothetical protein EVAR_320_1 [Eumeta japonica]